MMIRTGSDKIESAAPMTAAPVAATPLLRSLKVFIADDDAAVAELLSDLVVDIGHEVAAMETSHAAALAAAETVNADLAILDINLRGKPSFAIADRLATRGIPVIFATGYGILALSGKYEHSELLKKPFKTVELAQAIDRLTQNAAAGLRSLAPRGSTQPETPRSNRAAAL